MKPDIKNIVLAIGSLLLSGVICCGCRSSHVVEDTAGRTEFRIAMPANSLFVSNADSSRSKRNEINERVSANWHRDLVVARGSSLCVEFSK